MMRLMVLLCAVLGVVGCTRSTPGTAAAPSDVRPWSAEEQIRDLVESFEAAWNTRDYDGLRQMLCAELLADHDFSDSELDDARSEGTLDLTIVELEIDGDTADSIIENHGTDSDDIAFALEQGEWKWCEY